MRSFVQGSFLWVALAAWVGCAGGRPGGSGGGSGSSGGRDASTDRSSMGVDGGGGGGCDPACGDGMICCGGTCVSRDMSNCVACGVGCDPQRATTCRQRAGSTSYECGCGSAPECAPGTACVVEGGAPRCVDLQTDRNNCGMLGNTCDEGEICVGGRCSCGGEDCAAGQACCGGRCVDTSSDAANCGMCGKACQAGESCVDGTCRCGSGATARACRPRSDSDLGELCCDGACVPQDNMNCGSCGTTCSDGQMCAYGMDLAGMGARVCCALGFGGGVPIPGLGGICDPGSGGGLPGLDGGLPMP